MINWNDEQKTEPPLTMDMDEMAILHIIEVPLKLPHYPCHTQHVERIVPVVTESAMQRVGFINRHRWILTTTESREICPQLNTKKDDIAME